MSRSPARLQPRHAFARACKKLSDSRIIRQLGEDERTLTFQFTAESRAGDTFEYTLETLLRLDKQTGQVRCDLPGLATLAQEELDRAMEMPGGGGGGGGGGGQSGTDVTRVIRRNSSIGKPICFPFAIKARCGLFRRRFGTIRRILVDRVQTVPRGSAGGRLARFPVPAGTPRKAIRSVKTAVADGLAARSSRIIAAAVDVVRRRHARTATIRRAAERIALDTRFKIEAYADLLLEEEVSRLDREPSLAEAAQAAAREDSGSLALNSPAGAAS